MTFYKPENWKINTTDWHTNVGIACLKEAAAVFTALIVYSRIGAASPFYGGIILYLILVVFSFPFLNPYLFIFLRLGPFWKTDKVGGRYSYFNSFSRYAQQCIFMTLSQLLGAYAAATYRLHLDKTFNPELTFPPPPPPNNSTLTPNADQLRTSRFFDEFFAVTFLLIGLVHLIHALSPEFITNSYWVKQAAETEAKKNTNAKPFSGNVGCCDTSDVEISSKSSSDSLLPESSKQEQDNAIPVIVSPLFSIPVPLILTAACLVVALTVAFPTAHQAAHITMYLQFHGGILEDNAEWAARIGGGIMGTAAGILYYYIMYIIPAYSPFLQKHFFPQHTLNSKIPSSISSKKEAISFRL